MSLDSDTVLKCQEADQQNLCIQVSLFKNTPAASCITKSANQCDGRKPRGGNKHSRGQIRLRRKSWILK